MSEDYEADLPKRKTRLQKSWKNAPSRADLYSDYASAESGQEEFRAKLLEYEKIRDGGDEVVVNGLGKSTARPLLVRKSNEWKYPALEDPILSAANLFRVAPATTQDTLAAEQNAKVLNYQWNTKVKKTKLVGDIIRTVVDEGTVIVKTGWESDTVDKDFEEEVPVYASPEESLALMQEAISTGEMTPEQAQAMLETGEPMQIGVKMETVTREVLVKNQPSYEVCINANVTIDPTCDGIMDDALFVIHEYDTSWADLKSEKYEKDEDGEEFGFYHNLDFIDESGESDDYDAHVSDESNNFEFKDKARKRLRAYEYWGYWDIQGDGKLVGIVATWVGKTLIRLEENPFPHGRLPFSVATYMPVKKSVYGEPDAKLLKENQEAIGNMTRAIHDITTKQAVGQEFIDENFFPSPSQKNSYEKGNTVYYRANMDPKRAIYKNDVQQIGSAPFDVINWQATDANELTGNKPFRGPGGAKNGGGTKDKDSMDAVSKRELSILRRLSDLLFVDMARMTIAMNQVFLDEEIVVRITDKEFVPIQRDDLQGDFDLRIQVSTPERDDDQANKIMKLMQTNAANMDREISNMHYIKMAKLWKMDDLAEEVANYKPEPSKHEIELMQLQVEEQKLKNAILMKDLEDADSKIAERISRSEENKFDQDVKASKAEQQFAVAEKVKSETDILDANFVRLQEGIQRLEDIEDQEFKATTDAAIKQMDRSVANTSAKTVAEI